MVFKSELSSQNDSMTVIHLNGIDTYARSPLMSKNNNATNINGTKLKTTIKYIFFPPNYSDSLFEFRLHPPLYIFRNGKRRKKFIPFGLALLIHIFTVHNYIVFEGERVCDMEQCLNITIHCDFEKKSTK